VNVEVGTEVPPFVVESVPVEPMKTVAALLHDPNPIHFDVTAVRSLGMGDRTVNQGPTNMAYVANMLIRRAGDPAASASSATSSPATG
jgi:acyl dehydratase